MWRANTLPTKDNCEAFVQEVALADEAATRRLGARIAAHLMAGDVIALEGDLGSGKTTLARAILAALGVGESVPSPTFTLVQHYDTPGLAIDHFDLHRITDETELDQLGLEDVLAGGAALVEWPERAGARLPPSTLQVRLEIIGENERCVRIAGSTRWASAFGDSRS